MAVTSKQFLNTPAGRQAKGQARRAAMNKGRLPGLDKLPKAKGK